MNSYRTRMLQAADPRFAKIHDRLYGRRDMQAKPLPETDDITFLRAEYQRVVGKRPFNGWDAATLRKKIAEAKA